MADLFPEKITQWRCPHCGMVMDGKTYNIDSERKKCSKLWHKGGAAKQTYIREDKCR
jgi:ribosomal protein L37AE/L43A